MDIKSKISSGKIILKNIEKDNISASSAQCAYYIILSFIPFIILLLTLIQYTNIQPEQLFNIISKMIPSTMQELVLGIVMEVYSKSLGTISISLIFTLYAAHKGLFALIKGLYLVYNFNDNKSKSLIYLRLISILKTVIFIILIAIILVILVFGSTIMSTMQNYFGLFKNYTIISRMVTYMIYIFAIFIVFLCIYKFMSGYKLTFKSQLRGALFGSIALNIVSFIFARYLDIFRGFSITYGSLTTLMLVMMWVYACFYILFLGAEINKFYSIKKEE